MLESFQDTSLINLNSHSATLSMVAFGQVTGEVYLILG